MRRSAVRLTSTYSPTHATAPGLFFFLNCYIPGVNLLLHIEIKIPISKKSNKRIKDQTMLRTLTIILTIIATAGCLANPPAAQQEAPATRTIPAFPGAEGYYRPLIFFQ
jgi:hypothetical protein